MDKKDLILAIWDSNPDMREPIELLKRIDAGGDFPGATKNINLTRLAKLCRSALESESLSGEAKEEAEKTASTLDTAGGKRPGAGRKPSGKKKRNYYVTDGEHEEIKKLIEKMREGKK